MICGYDYTKHMIYEPNIRKFALLLAQLWHFSCLFTNTGTVILININNQIIDRDPYDVEDVSQEDFIFLKKVLLDLEKGIRDLKLEGILHT